ncbi:MAG: hypothetical protein ACI85O_000303 [Saprospiraceae bacterium]
MTGGVWFISEIQSAFDPCSCDYKSLLEIAPRLMEDLTITLDIAGTGESIQIIEEGVPLTGSSSGFNTAIDKTNAFLGAAINGQKSYKSLNDFNGTINGLFSNGGQDNSGFGSFLADFLKPIPYIGLAVPFLDLLIGGGGDDSDEAEPGPITFSNSYLFNGDGFISTSLPVEITSIATPGSTETSTSFVPDYNNILGVAGLLKKPVVNKFTIGDDDALVFWNLSEDLSYAINHLAGIDGTPIKAKAALIFRSCDVNMNWGSGLDGENYPPAHHGLFGGIQEEGSVTSGVEFRTPFMDIGCLSDYTVMSSYATDAYYGYGVRCDDDIDLRLMLVLDREDGQGEEIMFMATYNVDVVEGQSGNVPNPYWGIPETATANTLDEVLDGSVQAWNGVTILDDEVVDEANYDLVNDILGGDYVDIVIYPPGGVPYVTTIRREVAVGTEIEGGTLTVNAPPRCDEVYPATYRDIEKFCDRNYDPRAGSLVVQDGSNEITLSDERSEQITKSEQAVYPNPTAGKVVFQLVTQEKQEVEVGLYNTYGNEVKHLFTGELAAGQHEFNFNIRDQVSGVYYLTVREKDNVTTHKVIKKSSLQP